MPKEKDIDKISMNFQRRSFIKNIQTIINIADATKNPIYVAKEIKAISATKINTKRLTWLFSKGILSTSLSSLRKVFWKNNKIAKKAKIIAAICGKKFGPGPEPVLSGYPLAVNHT